MPPQHVYQGRTERLGDLVLRNAGKVRDIYEVDDEHLLFVTSDRVSAFDVLMPQGIPHKGRVLTAIAAHWFARTEDIVPNHLVSTDVADVPGLSADLHETLRGRIMLVRRCEPTPVEWVIRGYIVGSGWKDYQRTGAVCGVELPAGLEFCQELPEPIFTPTTKNDVHDEAITAAQARDLVGAETFEKALDRVKPAAQAVVQAFRELNEPDEIGLEFGIDFKTEANAFVLTGEASAAFKLSLTWKNSKS